MSSNEETMTAFNYHEINLLQGHDEVGVHEYGLLANSNYKIQRKLNNPSGFSNVFITELGLRYYKYNRNAKDMKHISDGTLGVLHKAITQCNGA